MAAQQGGQPAVRVDDTLSHQRWNDPQYPFNPLDRGTALQYFEFSPFFDVNSNNYVARQRGLDPANEQQLRSMPMGETEFALAETHEPHLFVVRKQQRQQAAQHSTGRVSVSNYYYILGHERHTFQAPSMHAAITARLQRSMHHVCEGFKRFKADLAPLPKVLKEAEQKQREQQEQAEQAQQALELGMQPPAAAAAAASAAAAAKAAAKPVAVPEVLTDESHDHWKLTDSIIMDVLRKYPAPRLPKSKAEEARRREELMARRQQKQQQEQQPPQQQQAQAGQEGQQQPEQPAGAAAIKAEPLDPGAAAAMPVPMPGGVVGPAVAAAAAPQPQPSKGLTRLKKMSSAKQAAAAAAAEPAMAAAAGEAAAGMKQVAGVKRARSAGEQQQQQYQQHYDPQQQYQQHYDPQQQQYHQQQYDPQQQYHQQQHYQQEGHYGVPVPTADTLSQGSAGRSQGTFSQGTFSQGGYSVAYSSAAAASAAAHPTTSQGTAGTAATAGGGKKIKIKLGKGIKLRGVQPPPPSQQ